MKVIFLDIDGVLDVFDPAAWLQELLGPALMRLKRIVDETDAKVVVVSDWRYGHEKYMDRVKPEERYAQVRDNWKQLVAAFREFEMIIHDVSPWEDGLKTRSDEIAHYLSIHPDITRYVILDDCYSDRYESAPELRSRLVFVDASKALQERDVELALSILAD